MASLASIPPAQNYNPTRTMFFDERGNIPKPTSNASAIRKMLEGHEVPFSPLPGDSLLLDLIRKEMELAGRAVILPTPVQSKPFVQPPETYVIPPYKGTYSSRSEEWGANRKDKPTNPVKFYADKVNLAHKAFMADGSTLEEYVSEVFGFLEDRASSDDVFGFLHAITEQLEAGTFCPMDAKVKFSTKLNTAWKAHCANEGISGSEEIDEEQDGATGEDPAPIIGVRNTVSVNKKTIMAAFDAYSDGVPNGFASLIMLAMKYARRAIAAKRDNGAEGMDTPDDYASAVGIKLWKELPAFKGDAFAFFKLLNKIQSNAGKDYVRKNKRETGNKVPLLVEFEDGDIEQNPLINRQQKQEHVRELPDWIQGNNRWICDLIREGMSYAQIATFLHLSEPAVKDRVAEMKKRNLEETKGSGIVKRIRVRGEWVDSMPKTE